MAKDEIIHLKKTFGLYTKTNVGLQHYANVYCAIQELINDDHFAQ